MIRARQLLSDCELALADFEAGGPTPYWRTRWIAMVAALRAVGHVLYKSDASQSTELKQAVDQTWAELKKTKPEPRVFWEFIEEQRNSVLKVYEVGARLNVTMRPGTAHLSFAEQGHTGPSEPTTYESFIRSGTYSGRDAIEVCREAILFWQKFLDDVEAAAAET